MYNNKKERTTAPLNNIELISNIMLRKRKCRDKKVWVYIFEIQKQAKRKYTVQRYNRLKTYEYQGNS